MTDTTTKREHKPIDEAKASKSIEIAREFYDLQAKMVEQFGAEKTVKMLRAAALGLKA